MDSKKIIKMWSLRILLVTLVVSYSSAQSCFASAEASALELEGKWGGNERSIISSTIPITATTDGHNIYIENANPDRDIIITIINYATGQIVYSQTIPATSTTYIVISIEELPIGECRLELNSTDGDYLQGYFIKE